MSILIKGMEMPTSCYKCPLRRRDGMDIVCPVAHERFSVADVNILDYRLKNCPLVHIPPHGRLISAFDTVKTLCDKGLYMHAEIVSDMPTIIPAEEWKR